MQRQIFDSVTPHAECAHTQEPFSCSLIYKGSTQLVAPHVLIWLTFTPDALPAIPKGFVSTSNRVSTRESFTCPVNVQTYTVWFVFDSRNITFDFNKYLQSHADHKKTQSDWCWWLCNSIFISSRSSLVLTVNHVFCSARRPGPLL